MLFMVTPPLTAIEYLHICLTLISLTLAYFVIYPGLEADSPSVMIVNAIFQAHPNGLEPGKLEETLTDELIVKPRVQDLIQDKMAFKKEDRYYLTPKGLFLSRVFLQYRKLFNLPKGG